MNTEKISINLSPYAKNYLKIVFGVFIVSSAVCAGLFANVFGFTDHVNSYLMGELLADGILRMCSTAALMTVIIDIVTNQK